ncbi:MAG: hypothetical protein ACNA8G_07745 [Gammaproteobacteria bacterium]
MFKRYLPLLFVLFVVLATVVAFLLFRDAGAPDAPAPVSRDGATPSDGVPEFKVESEEEFQRALEALGTSTEEIEAWARSHGFPPATYTSAPGTPLGQNYRAMREPELRELAEGGDPWAMQFLAAHLSPEKPLEAVDWYRKAVVNGSAYAAIQLSSLYREVARRVEIDQDNREAFIEIARREEPLADASLAWLLIAEHEAGVPPGSIAATLTSFKAPDDSITRACERAATLLAGIQAEREAKGVSVPVRKPPLAIELPAEETLGYCPPEIFPRADFAGCETVRLVGDIGAITGHRCR